MPCRMGTKTFIVCTVLVLVVGIIGRITDERTVNTTTPAYAQQNDDTRLSCWMAIAHRNTQS